MATETLRGTVAQPRPATGLWRDAFGRLRKNRLAMVGLIVVLFLFFIAIFGPYLAPYPYYAAGHPGRRPQRRPAAAAAEPGSPARHGPDRP